MAFFMSLYSDLHAVMLNRISHDSMCEPTFRPSREKMLGFTVHCRKQNVRALSARRTTQRTGHE